MDTWEAIRQFVSRGLFSWEKDDIEAGEDNILYSHVAKDDLAFLQKKMPPEAFAGLQQAVASLGTIPKQSANLSDPMLDVEGVRCLSCNNILIFYRYNSAFNLIQIIRLANDRKDWETLLGLRKMVYNSNNMVKEKIGKV